MDNGREAFKQFLKTKGYNSVRDFAEEVLHLFQTTEGSENKKVFITGFKNALDMQYGSEVRHDVSYLIAKIHKEQREIEEDILEFDNEEYDRICEEYDKQDWIEKKAMKQGKRHLDYYDENFDPTTDYEPVFEDDTKIYRHKQNVVTRKLRKPTK